MTARNAPLVAALTRRLIWSFETGGRWVTGFVEGDRILDVAGSALAFEGEALRVRLWHPMQCEAAEGLAWRQRLASLQITQPFKQAHREVYVLTDAERETKTHSSRFAAHVVDGRYEAAGGGAALEASAKKKTRRTSTTCRPARCDS